MSAKRADESTRVRAALYRSLGRQEEKVRVVCAGWREPSCAFASRRKRATADAPCPRCGGSVQVLER